MTEKRVLNPVRLVVSNTERTTTTRYKAWYDRIEEVQAVKADGYSITVLEKESHLAGQGTRLVEREYPLIGGECSFHETWDAAHTRLLSTRRFRVQRIEQELREARAMLEAVEALKPPQ